MNRVPLNEEKSGFQKNFEKNWLRKFSVRVILDTYLWRQGSRFRARVAEGKPAFRDRYSWTFWLVQLSWTFWLVQLSWTFFISPATAGRLLKILTMLLYEGIQE